MADVPELTIQIIDFWRCIQIVRKNCPWNKIYSDWEKI